MYWDYARDTPFYERLIKRVAESIVPNAMRLKAKKHQPALNDSNPLRRVIDPIAPLGSKRREAMKAAGRLVRGRK